MKTKSLISSFGTCLASRLARIGMTAVALLCLGALSSRAQTVVFSDDFNRASLGGGYTISQGGGSGTAFIVGSTTLLLTNGPTAGWVSVATNLAAGAGFSSTLDSCAGLVTWSFNMRFARTGGTPSGFSSASYGVGYVLAADNSDFSAAGSKGYAILYGNGSSPDTFRLVAFTNGIRADYTVAGTAAGTALIVGTGAFATTTQAQANDYYSFQVSYDPATQTWTFNGRDDGNGGFADPTSGSFTTIGTFTETTPVFRSTPLGRTGAYWSHSTGAGQTSQFDNFKLTVVQPSVVVVDNTGTPATGNVVAGTTAALFGFQLSPSASANFTGLKLTTTGTATAADLSNFQVVYDADNSGTYNAGDTVVSASPQSLAASINFSISGQSAINTPRRYLVIASVAPGATAGHTFTGSIAAAADVTTSIPSTGTAAGNPQTIISAVYDLQMTSGGGESATLSSIINNATISSVSDGAQVWVISFANPAGNAGAATISGLTLTQGANNTVANWANTIQAAELFNGSTALAAGTISASSIAFSGLNVSVPDNGAANLSLRISLKNTPGALTDHLFYQFALAPGDVTVTGNGVSGSAINSDGIQNQLDVVATRLAFTSAPAFVQTNTVFSATVQAQDANGNRDLDDVSSVTISLATGAGTLTGGNPQFLATGSKTWSSLSYDNPALGTFSLQADNGTLTPGISPLITAVQAPTLTEVLVPQYIQGVASGSSNGKRLPYAFCVTISNLTANATYRYYNQCVVSSDSDTTAGAGNIIFVSASGSFGRSTGPSLNTSGNYGTFTADASGAYTGWFITEPTGNTRFGTTGNQVYMRIALNDGANGTSVITRLTTVSYASVLPFGTDLVTGTGIHGNSLATAKNMVVLYDNVAGTGRPLAATLVEDDGQAENSGTSYVSFYSTAVDGVAGAWGTIIPNNNANGVQRIEQRSLTGSLVVANTDSDGIWPSGANTVNPLGGDTTPIVITATDAPLASASPIPPVITRIQVTGGTVLIDFTGGASDTTSDFSVVSSASLRTAMAPVGATFTSSGPGVFRASVPGTSAPAFFRIKR